ncbi:DUF4277 domain-containing protein [Endozoicomonas sp. SCSIO W0465]|uniref:DUF4277 domain-containing protein n=1 Tax=Endozoicomonas sp. SCSIO W0465 TaxID=2918516 RepID=UPI0035318E2C
MFRSIKTPPIQHQIKNLNHLGLVAAIYRELKIAEYFDTHITIDPDARNVTIGLIWLAFHGKRSCSTRRSDSPHRTQWPCVLG